MKSPILRILFRKTTNFSDGNELQSHEGGGGAWNLGDWVNNPPTSASATNNGAGSGVTESSDQVGKLAMVNLYFDEQET